VGSALALLLRGLARLRRMERRRKTPWSRSAHSAETEFTQHQRRTHIM